MKKLLIFCMVFILGQHCILFAQLATGNSKFLGSVIPASVPSSFDTYWNQVTPENSTKWGSVEGTRNAMNWTQADIAYNHAQTKGYKFKFHTLIWGSQYPSWLTSLSATEQKAEIEQWMQAAAARYPNIWAIDVVNEPVKTPCPFKNALGGDGVTGWDWVIESFRLARQYFPNAKLLINEYGTENDANARNTYLTIINLLKARGYIDGLGVQAHYFNLDNMSAAQMSTCLNAYAATALDVYISELDITGGNNETNQKNKYQELFPIMWEHASVKGITLWGYIVGQTWRNGTGIVNSNGTERQAMVWLKQYMSGAPAPTLSVSPNSLSVAATSTINTITVTSNQSWTVSDNQNWLSTSVTSGSNNGSFTISTTSNTGTSNRSGIVTVTGGGINQTISVTQAGTSGGAGSRTFIVRARGTSGGAKLQLRINNIIITTWNLTTNMANYSANSSTAGIVRLQFINDATNRDVQVDYLQVNNTVYQSENQSVNTAYFTNGICGGGGNNEMMHCNGYIEYAGSNASIAALTNPIVMANNIFTLYPNPSKRGDNISISCSSPMSDLQIIDLSGKVIKSIKNINQNIYSFASDLQSGSFILSINKNGIRENKKMIIH